MRYPMDGESMNSDDEDNGIEKSNKPAGTHPSRRLLFQPDAIQNILHEFHGTNCAPQAASDNSPEYHRRPPEAPDNEIGKVCVAQGQKKRFVGRGYPPAEKYERNEN